jgi:hypothetical protein
LEKVKMQNEALFARISETQARLHANVYFRTSEDPSRVRLLCTIEIWGERGNPFTPLQYACCISPALKSVQQRFSGVLIRTIHDDTTILGDTESIFSKGGARGKSLRPTSPTSALHEGKAYELIPEERAQIRQGIKQPSAI